MSALLLATIMGALREQIVTYGDAKRMRGKADRQVSGLQPPLPHLETGLDEIDREDRL